MASEAAAPPQPRRWPRIPTSVVVAVIGVALGSWLIPAFTRQWDDRQKAGELKAALVTQMATVTGRALMDAQAAHDEHPGSPAAAAAIKDWSIGTLEIRARLQAYFEQAAIDRWALVNQYVSSTLAVAYGHRQGTGADASIVLAVVPYAIAGERSTRLEGLYRSYLTGDALIDTLEQAILDEQDKAAKSILDMHVRGYSTTWHDVVGDLLP